MAATTVMPVAKATGLVDDLVDAAHRTPSAGVPGVRTFLTGSGHDTPDVYAALEAAGLCVVGEDHDRGGQFHERRVDGTDEWALAERYQDTGPAAASASIRRRAAHTAAAATESGAQALLGYVRAHDPAPPWDFPHQRAGTGLPSALLRDQPYGGVSGAALRAAVEALTTSTGARR